MRIKISPRERDTILAALRAWQADACMPTGLATSLELEDIATNGGENKPLDADENEMIDRLIDERVTISPGLREFMGTASPADKALMDEGLGAWARKIVNDMIGPEYVYRVTLNAWRGTSIINAIKFVRSHWSHMGLKEAKDICEVMRDEPRTSYLLEDFADQNTADTFFGLCREQGFDGTLEKVQS